MTGPRIAIIYYSLYGHIRQLAVAMQKAIVEAGGQADLFQVPETLTEEVLTKMGAPPKSGDPIATNQVLQEYDAFLFGIPTRFGTFPTQWRAFWDYTMGLWAQRALHGKYAGLFVSTGTPGGGQEVTALNAMSTLAHHGIIYVPLGYKHTFTQVTNLDEVHGGSPWGAGTFAGPDASRQPSALELDVAQIQGREFYLTVKKAFN
ncbi:flavo protein-like protein [Yarrowia lipolytica]|uniref:YALI0B07029p n=2 Tax=Yarrowia lipolytica TaxID=4952 RepID=Q6CFH0_YARLI|nr:YALI0B07029p [Yarrowia lipolytica CLIB122]AOW01336.1 hypothetical protein YALI1_B09117g [Yarrowia lipolytica]KAB8281836.1 flavo protein-like protein [Yarrowia lipolytica]KAE8171607.1 flavo protein-like protein [Yarrowia lipolytica]KAJ8052193.1 flavoprotein-like protein [Yarrowia lipolytica]QNP96603.1 Protoplast secreted protein 2 [Yarrowia lipolytica]|eukprot:XP_500592.1 YALI0B07029p [Yarrowia lipolytica CLIB122]